METTIDKPGTSFQWSSFGISHVGKVRKLNEDSKLERPEIGLWVVADGMGGHSAGDYASQMIVAELGKVHEGITLDRLLDDIEDRLLEVNDKLITKSLETTGKNTIGSTVVGMAFFNEFIIMFWAGDSRLYRLRDSQLHQMTIDHSQVEIYIEQGLITREEAVNHPHGNMITRAVGATEDLYIDFDIQKVQAGDRYVLCSDGLTKHLSDQDIEDMLNEGKNTEDTCTQLVELTLDRGAGDNTTAIVIDVK